MKTIAAPVLLALTLGAAAPAAAQEDGRRVAGRMRELRDEGGVCAHELQGVALATYLQLVVCIGTGAPGTVSDDHKPWIYWEVQTDPKHVADARDWKLTVTGQDGKVLLKERSLAKEALRPPKNPCGASATCRQSALGFSPPMTEWKPGTYRFKLAYVHDPEITTDLAIQLVP